MQERRQARYQVRLYGVTDGSLIAVFDSWLDLTLTRVVNGISQLELTLSASDKRVALFQLDAFVEVWRRIQRAGSRWYVEDTLLYRDYDDAVDENGQHTVKLTCYGLADLLHRREIAYPQTTPGSLKQGPAETVMKAYVSENCTPAAVSPPRVRPGVLAGFTIETDYGAGSTWTGDASFKNLLNTLMDIASTQDVDFSVVRTGPLSVEFRTLLSVVPRIPVLFSTGLGNMIKPEYILARVTEAQVILVLGDGQGTDRHVVPVESPRKNDSRWNDAEISESASASNQLGGDQASTTLTYEQMLAAGAAALKKTQPQETLTFSPRQTYILQYGADYMLGDYVAARVGDLAITVKVLGVKISVKEGVEAFDFTFGNNQRYVVVGGGFISGGTNDRGSN